ncbi:MAG: glucosyl-3-phosphoglycerate synthase [Desulfobulbus sp.]|jgi:glucosyl-3-phosphoglycerate synthase|uniref:glucosyl-3-phosphoglycerate synthase n=1 Tax=Desulfobulbus sp. TaxID=895 RepID=UPI0028409869|nr:glucosyl-3-phosphoglycerate synthase [Desulfobulbus sp.]MDR2549451.1 glucosyl-3-phosphoglycerate synthase [Desulfobulbus sp.]
MDRADRWLSTRTFHHRKFADTAALIRLKQAQGLRLSLVIPTFNEAQTIGTVLERLLPLRDTVPLVDEIAVVDSGSTDSTVERAGNAGAAVYRAEDILPGMGAARGKGENLWKALDRLSGDILVALDADIANMHPRFVTGLVGPLLQHPEIGYVKACYDRPACPDSGALGGGRVTEILVRPLFSLHFPELTGFIQPLAGEFAARRSLLETIPFPVGYGVEAAHLVDLHARHGLSIFAQTDLGQRLHRNRGNEELGRMACAILQVLERRLHLRGRRSESTEPGCLIRQFVRHEDSFAATSFAIDELERPPMLTVAAYRHRRMGRDERQDRPRTLATHPTETAAATAEE